MFCMKCGGQIKVAFAVVAIALLTGGCEKGGGNGAVVNHSEPSASSARFDEYDARIKIDIGPPGVVFKDRGVTFKELDGEIEKLAASSKNCKVIVRCTLDSPHGFLIRVLDICHKYKMPPPRIYSM